MGNKRCNPSSILIKFNLVKSPFKIQTTEHCSFIQVVKNIIHSRYWMSFSDHGLVCLTHVYAYSYLLCSSFWHHYDRAYPWSGAFNLLNNVSFQQFCQLFLYRSSEVVRNAPYWLCHGSYIPIYIELCLEAFQLSNAFKTLGYSAKIFCPVLIPLTKPTRRTHSCSAVFLPSKDFPFPSIT